MENIKERLSKANFILDSKLKKLEELETEKKDIIERFSNANDKERAKIEQEMKTSEEKFIALSDEVSAIAEKIKKLKKIYC